ncbi:MAG: tetratricopeptide repeat protein, partial [Isosphaeraceae bacterium]
FRSDAYQAAAALRPNEYWTLFRMGKALEADRQPGRAESVYRACLAVAPGDPTVQNSLGTLLLSLKRWEDAAVELEAVVGNHPDYLMAYSNLMMAYAERADVPRTEDVFTRLRKRAPDASNVSDAWNHLGLAHERARNDQKTRECYDKAIEADPRSARALRNRATVLIRQEKFEDALADVDAAIRLAPSDGELRYVKGNVYAFWERPREAILEYAEALRIDPKLVFAQNNRAVMLGRLGRLEEAIEDYRAVLEAAPNHPDALVSIANCYARMGQRDRAPSRLRQALNVVAEVLDRDPRNVDALLLRGKLHGDLGKYQDGIGPDVDLVQSEADLSEVIRLAPNEPDGYRSRGKTRHTSRNWKGAIEDWNRYLKLVPDARDAADIANDLSTAHLELGEIDKAIEELNKAKRGGVSPSYFSNLGNVYLKEGALDRAVVEFDRAIRTDPRHTRAWALRGQARLRQGRFAEAVADLDRALELEPGLYETLALNGTAKIAAGDVRGARIVLDEVVKDRPDHARGRYAMGWLRLLDGDGVNAILELSRAMGDPILREFALGPRAEAWLSVGGGGLAAATADAESLCQALPRDGHAHLSAARIFARAAARATAERAGPWRERAVALLERALTLQADLRPRALDDPVLRPLLDAPGPTSSDGGS